MTSHHHGLNNDLELLLRTSGGRRLALRWLGVGGASILPLAGCGGGSSDATVTAASVSDTTGITGTTTSIATTPQAPASCSTIPSETAGPYPADGTNASMGSTSNALTLAGIVRTDIRSSVAGAAGTAFGVPLTLQLRLVNTAASCASLAGYAVYLWHCDALGRYSLYSSGVTGENYLRGVQVSDSSGLVTFTSIVPGCYAGRWPHIHFEIFPSLAAATSGNSDIRTSQLALPADICSAVYVTSGYTGSTANLAGITLASDNVFSDGSSLQMASVTGSVAAGYVATLQVGVSA